MTIPAMKDSDIRALALILDRARSIHFIRVDELASERIDPPGCVALSALADATIEHLRRQQSELVTPTLLDRCVGKLELEMDRDSVREAVRGLKRLLDPDSEQTSEAGDAVA